eukprot:TRINITY_DN182_c0_g2_i2.p3 TRINITY_DN182_c0_g2~~TRINITY_DN182_c0_g2_i2.p3  ORF type:complete len:141 (+),score=34.13 TRINITY_DN182_c0_g2_i2:60-482(+)
MCIRDRYQRRVRDTFKQLETMLLVLCVVACVALINAHDLIEPVRVGGAVSRKRQATEEDLGAASPCKDSELAICARTQVSRQHACVLLALCVFHVRCCSLRCVASDVEVALGKCQRAFFACCARCDGVRRSVSSHLLTTA